MANDVEELTDLRRRVDALESLVQLLSARIDGLEVAGGAPHEDFHMGDEEPTV